MKSDRVDTAPEFSRPLGLISGLFSLSQKQHPKSKNFFAPVVPQGLKPPRDEVMRKISYLPGQEG